MPPQPSREPQGYYAASAGPSRRRPSLHGEAKADVCIVGAGFTGLSAALHLAERGARVAVLEAQTVAYAASGRNGGQIHSGFSREQSDVEKLVGPVHARALWDLAEESKALLRERIARHRIDCDLKPGLVIAAHDAAAELALAHETEYLAKTCGYSSARMMDRLETSRVIGTHVYGAARFDMGGGHLHPLRYAHGLAAAAEAAGVAIFEHSRALSFDRDDGTVHSAGGRVNADHIILACDAFTGELAPEIARYIGQLESFMTATAPLPEPLASQILPSDVAVADTRHVLDYYRKSADGRLLFAGRESYFTVPSDIAKLVRPRMLRVYPMLENVPTDYAWCGTVGITVTRMPHFGRLGKRALFAHGYSGQGVALSAIGGTCMAEAVLGRSEKFDTFARVPAKAFPGGRALRKPLVAAALFALKIADAV